MGKDDLIEAARLGNYPTCEKILSTKPKKPGPFASLRRGSGGCNSRDSSGYTALHYAALNGHVDIVELLLTYEASCNSADEKGSSPLHLAAWAGHAQIVEILLTRGPSIANVNLTNSDKETALHSAAQYGHLEAVKLLLKHGADPNIKNCREETALDLAALYGRRETVQLLLETHPELVGPYTAYGGAMYIHTPLHLASRNGHNDVVDLILQTGFDINARTARGTALHEAALCGKLDVVKSLLEAGINMELRDQNDKTVLEIMDELKTQRTREIIHAILDHMGVRRRVTSSASVRPPHSPYDNLSLTQSLEESSFSIDLEFGSANTSRASSRCMGSPVLGAQRPRSAKSVEDIVDRRVSSLSTTSGCSDCTTATLQGAKSYGSSFFEDAASNTPRLLDSDDNTSLSSDEEFSSNHSQIMVEQAETKAKSSTLTREADPPPPLPTVAVKPQVPAKPLHIRPGLKPVKIPTVDDKVWPQNVSGTSTAPRKPPRRNVSVSPIRGQANTMIASSSTRRIHGSRSQQETSSNAMTMYTSKSGSKSFDELDDLLFSAAENKKGKKARKVKKAGSHFEADHNTSGSEAAAVAAGAKSDPSRHSCDELMMTRSLYEAETSDTGSQISTAQDCRRCILNKLSNRTMSLDCNELINSSRFISQRQYKRKLKRDCPSYATMDRSKVSKKADEDMKMTMVSKTTFKLRSSEALLTSEDDFELMEIPLSPTHYDQPSTPDHEPPSALEAEKAIMSVLDNLRMESKRFRRSKGTEIEPCYLLPLGKTSWPSKKGLTKEDKATTMDLEMQPPKTTKDSGDHSQSRKESCSSPTASVASQRSHLRLDNLQVQMLGHASASGTVGDHNRHSTGSESQNLSILSPFDEKEEWNKISEIINSFGTNIGKDVKESTTPNNSPNEEEVARRSFKSVAEWLKHHKLEPFEKAFIEHGFDNIDFIGEDIIAPEDLETMGIKEPEAKELIMNALKSKGYCKGSSSRGLESDKADSLRLSVEEWLLSISLQDEYYTKSFEANLYTGMDRVIAIWDDELTSILDIEKIGHRKRILLSLAGRDGMPHRFGKVQIEQNDQKIMEVDLADPKANVVVSGKTTLGRSRKKKAAPQPPVGKAATASNLDQQANSSKKAKRPPDQEFLAFKVRYFAKRSTKDFKGLDTTKSAIESSKKSKGGRQRFLVLSEKDVKILKRDAKELVTSHKISNVCCVVRDQASPNIFGYVTTTESGQNQNVAHVFTADSNEKAGEILSLICEGFSGKNTKLDGDNLEPQDGGSPSPPSSSSSGALLGSNPSRFKSDTNLVSRMRLFFQGKDPSSSSSRSHSPGPHNHRRKRGGSVDNLLDDLGDDVTLPGSMMSKDTKKKSVSTKNLSLGSNPSETIGQQQLTTAEDVRITTV